MVAGGGGGWSGGGGAGGLIYSSSYSLTSGSYPITIGAGGSAGAGAAYPQGTGGNGTNSVFATFTAIGGGGGGTVSQLTNGSLHVTLNSDGQLVMPPAAYAVVLDTTSSCVQNIAQNGTYDFVTISGEILINDLYDGQVYKFLVGGGKVCLAGCTDAAWNGTHGTPGTSFTVSGSVSMTFNGGYTFTNLKSQRNYSFTVIKTRNSS